MFKTIGQVAINKIPRFIFKLSYNFIQNNITNMIFPYNFFYGLNSIPQVTTFLVLHNLGIHTKIILLICLFL